MRSIGHNDRKIIRDLARRKIEIANDPVNLERRRLWYALHDLKGERAMVLAEFAAVIDGHKPYQPELKCVEDWARSLEYGLRCEIWRFESLQDDHVVEPWIGTHWDVSIGGYGLDAIWHQSDNPGIFNARRWDAPITDIRSEIEKLHPRSFSVNRESSLARKESLEELFDGILSVRFRGGYMWTYGMTQTAAFLIGLEQLMLKMYDDPDGLHQLMNFLYEDHQALVDWLEREQLLCFNNENDYVGSGSEGYTHALPQPDWCEGMPARKKDLWILMESQETVGVGPQLFEEFVFPYQKKLSDQFGLVYHGCCEPVHTRWEVLKKISNLRAISVSPWCDEDFMAEALGREYVYSRKPNPALISTECFDEDAIRMDLRKTLQTARGCNVEIIMKDVHTLNGEPQRLARWVQIAKEEASSVAPTSICPHVKMSPLRVSSPFDSGV